MARNHCPRTLAGVVLAAVAFATSCGSMLADVHPEPPPPVEVDLFVSTLPDVGTPAPSAKTLVRVTIFKHLCGDCGGADTLQAEHVRAGPPGAIAELPWHESFRSFQETRPGYDANYTVEVDLGSQTLHFDATGPALHTFSVDPSPPVIAMPATVNWTPSGEPPVHIGVLVSGAGGPVGPIDNGVGPDDGSAIIPASAFAVPGDYRIEVARTVDTTTSDPDGNRFVNDELVQVGLDTTIP